MALTPITAKASLDAADFTAGVMEIRKRLNELNAAYESNKAKMKQLGIEMNKLEREKRKLTEQMEDGGGTDEQKMQLEALKDRISQVAAQLGSMRTKETELKSELKAATQTLEEEKKAAASASEGLEKHGNKIDELKNNTQSLETAMKTVSEVLKDEEIAAETSSHGLTVLRKNVIELNNALIEHRGKAKTVSEGLQELQKREKELTSLMKDGGTAEQKEQLEFLKKQIMQTSSAVGVLNLKEEELKTALKSAAKALEEEKKAADSVAGSLDDQDRETVELKNDTKELSSASDTAKTSVLNLGTAIKALIASAAAKTLWTALIGSNAEMEQTLTAFTVMLGDAEEAKKLVAEMTEFAASTPLELPDVTAASRMLMNYGVAADEVIEKITRLGNLAGGNAEKLDRVSLAYGQMLAKGKVAGEELRQMTEAGVPLLQALADTLGASTAEVQDMISKSKVGIDDLDRAIESLATGNGQFSGMMEKQSQTLTGMLSTARDLLGKFGREVGEEAFAEAKDALSDLLETIRELEADGTLAQWAKKLGNGFADVVRWAKEIVSAVLSAGEPIAEMTGFIIENKEAVLAGIAVYKGFTAVPTIVNTVTKAVQGLNAAMIANPAGLIAAGIGLLIPIVSSVAKEMNAAKIAANEYSDSLLKINQSAEAITKKGDQEAEALNRKVERYNELRLSAERTAAQEAELQDIAGELQSIFGESASVVNGLTGDYNDLTEAARNYTDVLKAQAKVEAEKRRLEELYSLKQEIEERKAASERELMNNVSFQTGVFYLDNLIAGESFKSREAEIDEFNRQIKSVEEQINETASRIEEHTHDYYETVAGAAETTAKSVVGSAKSAALSLEEIKEAAENGKKATGELAKEAKSLSSAFAEQNEDGSLSIDTILSLVDAGYAAALAVDAETGAVRLETEAYKELARAKLEAQKADLLEQRGQAVRENIERMKTASGSGDHQRIAELQAENKAIVMEYDVQIAALDSIDLDKVTSGTYGSASSSQKNDSEKSKAQKTDGELRLEQFKSEKAALQYERDMELVREEEYYKRLAELRDQYLEKDSGEWRSVNVEIRRHEKSNEISGGDKYRSEKSDLEYQRDMDEITEAEYYAELEKLRDKYLEKDGKEWRAATLEIRKYAKTLETDAGQAYKDANSALKAAADERLKIIDEELDAKKKARDEAIAAIDAEIEARKRLNEDTDIQREIDAVNAQLQYAQLDEFSQRQLERKLQSLQNEQAERSWERSVEDRKAAINARYENGEEAANDEKERINSAVEGVENALNKTSDGIKLTADGIALAADEIERAAATLSTVLGTVGNAAQNGGSVNNYNDNTQNFQTSVSFASQNLSTGQIVQAIMDAIRSSPIF